MKSKRSEDCLIKINFRWSNISASNFGMSVLNDSKFEWECRGSALTLFLLKAPEGPNDTCGMKNRTFKYDVMPHKGTSN